MAKRNFWPLVRDYCAERGWLVDECSPRRGGKIDTDLFGFIDAVALVPQVNKRRMTGDGQFWTDVQQRRHFLAIQWTDKSHKAARLAKIRTKREAALAWLDCGGRIELWLFDQHNQLDRVPVTREELEDDDG